MRNEFCARSKLISVRFSGSMMIEVVPFLHVIAFSISDRLGGVENAHAVIATTMVAYALTSILTGMFEIRPKKRQYVS